MHTPTPRLPPRLALAAMALLAAVATLTVSTGLGDELQPVFVLGHQPPGSRGAGRRPDQPVPAGKGLCSSRCPGP